jgi:hypothetical protein
MCMSPSPLYRTLGTPSSEQRPEQRRRSSAVTAVDQPSARPHHLCNSTSCPATRTLHSTHQTPSKPPALRAVACPVCARPTYALLVVLQQLRRGHQVP